MAVRIITSAFGLVVFFGVLLTGIIPFSIAVGIVAVVMLYEFLHSTGQNVLTAVCGFVCGIGIMVCSLFSEELLKYAIIISIILFMLVMLFLHGDVNYKKILSAGFGVLYISLFMSALITLRIDYEVFGVLIVFVCAWLTDTGAYFCGRAFGKHKLMPRVSPKKTVEGAVGGIVTCMISCVIYLFIARKIGMAMSNNIDYLPIVLIGLCASVLSQMGDLVASCIKRDCDIKDYGHLLPGHGGALDRFDSVLFIAPIILLMLRLVI